MDISLPQMDELTAMRPLRANSSISQIPMIALTTLAIWEDEEWYLAMGGNVYLTKPIRLVQLL